MILNNNQLNVWTSDSVPALAYQKEIYLEKNADLKAERVIHVWISSI